MLTMQTNADDKQQTTVYTISSPGAFGSSELIVFKYLKMFMYSFKIIFIYILYEQEFHKNVTAAGTCQYYK